MKLTPAEDWLKLAFNGQPALLNLEQVREPSLRFYRSIQSNALLWALDQIKDDANTPNTRAIRELAEQLNPTKL